MTPLLFDCFEARHTKEGVSKGNAGGPWDGASGPMNGCMRGLKANSSLDMLWCVCPPAFEGTGQVAAGPRWQVFTYTETETLTESNQASIWLPPILDLTVVAAQGWLMVCTPVHADTVG